MKTYKLEILTPEYQFFSGDVVCLTLQIPDGKIGIMADHIPFFAPVGIGSAVIRTEESSMTAFNSEGFLEVTRTHTVLFCQTCEWPEDVEINRALASKKHAEEKTARQKSLTEYKAAQLSLARAMERLRTSGMRK